MNKYYHIYMIDTFQGPSKFRRVGVLEFETKSAAKQYLKTMATTAGYYYTIIEVYKRNIIRHSKHNPKI